eukprot:TRINITY_DN16423_c0_g1_i2.p1 TRINITY_DN16423_c0_g1~~TRINITY_DN16423_c0_g1_i2.p1  ORF type:complete len:452 (-),score=78.00 TRINITY_DN16423_c0_g1_i2:1181-2536(-)
MPQALKSINLLAKLRCGIRNVNQNRYSACRLIHSSQNHNYSGAATDELLDRETLHNLDVYSRYNPAPISIKHLLEHGRSAGTADSFLFLRKEIPTRLANMIMELRLLPSSLMEQRECQEIYQDYIRSFKEMMLFEGLTSRPDTHGKFTDSLQNIRIRHIDTVPNMAQAVLRMNKNLRLQDGVTDTIQYFLDRLYTNRISIHMLISHYQSLHGIKSNSEGLVGTIDPQCDLLRVAEEAYSAASLLCDNEYFDHPELKSRAVDTTDENAETQGRVTAVYVPAHLHHILFEVFKNAMRASCEWAEKNEESTIPFIRLRIYKTNEDITLKISDRGGGMSRRTKRKIFNYMYSTASNKVSYEGIGGGSYGVGISASTLPMHGLGYGLPLSRLYARYFRGDIKVASVDGFGTDVYVYLQRLSHMAQENLPVYNYVSSSKLLATSTQVPDWTNNKEGY